MGRRVRDPYLNAYLSGKARGSKKARSRSISWSLIFLTFSGLRGGGSLFFKKTPTLTTILKGFSYVSLARSELWIIWSI